MKKSKFYSKGLKAIIPTLMSANGKNHAPKKEMVAAWTLVSPNKDAELATVRWYMSRAKDANRVYCTVWVHSPYYGSGTGKADGYGYCKMSEAFARAVENAGIDIKDTNTGHSYDAGGRGETEVARVLFAIGRAMGARKMSIINHGW